MPVDVGAVGKARLRCVVVRAVRAVESHDHDRRAGVIKTELAAELVVELVVELVLLVLLVVGRLMGGLPASRRGIFGSMMGARKNCWL